MENKYVISFSIIILLLSMSVLLTSVSAVPQVIFSNENISIWSNQSGNTTTGSFRLWSEGLDATTTFSVIGNCNFSYYRENIPITFSREIVQNETDIATLIHALAINNNITAQWQECNRNLSWCMNDVGYKGNYTQAAAELDTCYRARDAYSTQITDLNNQISSVTSWRNIGFIVGIIGIALAAWLYRKQTLKVITNPYKSIPVAALQH